LVYLFEFDKDKEWQDEKQEWYAKMFRHSAAIEEDMYKRLITKAARERRSSRAKNWFISQDWHQFLKFPSAVQGSTKALICYKHI
jgi:hypothetical protein